MRAVTKTHANFRIAEAGPNAVEYTVMQALFAGLRRGDRDSRKQRESDE